MSPVVALCADPKRDGVRCSVDAADGVEGAVRGGGSGGFAAAESSTSPPATIDAPPVMTADEVGFIELRASKLLTFSAPPVAL